MNNILFYDDSFLYTQQHNHTFRETKESDVCICNIFKIEFKLNFVCTKSFLCIMQALNILISTDLEKKCKTELGMHQEDSILHFSISTRQQSAALSDTTLRFRTRKSNGTKSRDSRALQSPYCSKFRSTARGERSTCAYTRDRRAINHARGALRIFSPSCSPSPSPINYDPPGGNRGGRRRGTCVVAKGLIITRAAKGPAVPDERDRGMGKDERKTPREEALVYGFEVCV